MNHHSVNRIHRFSAWILIQALLLTQTLPAHATQNLRVVEQSESKGGLEELRQKLTDGIQAVFSLAFSGLEEIATVEQAMDKFFRKGSGRDEELLLEQFLAERWAGQIRAAADALQSVKPKDVPGRRKAEGALQAAVRRHEEQIDEFVRRIEKDRRNAGVFKTDQRLGTYRLPPLDPKEIPAPGQKSGSGDLAIDIPSNRAYYELERLRLMARTAIQRSLGREVVVNIGIGFVGTAVTTATAAESKRDFGKIPTAQKRNLSYRLPLEGEQNAYFTIAYQRPSPASAYKVPAVNSGVSPIATQDATVGQKIAETTQKGILIATFLSGSIALADTVMLETELHVAKVLPTHLEHSKIQDEATVRLIRQVAQLMRADALVIVESTIAPGFLRNKLLPAMNEELQKREVLAKGKNANLAHAFQRLEPGPRWYQSLLEQERVGAGVTDEANQKLKSYFETVGFTHRILSRVESVEFMKTLENAWRFGLLELMSAYMRAGEVVGVDTFEVARAIARARPGTHGLIAAIPNIQVGGYCVPKEMIQIVASLADYYGVSSAEIMEIFNTRFGAAIASDFRGRLTPARAAEALAEAGIRLDDARVHIIGITYGAGVSDTRMSGVERVIRELAALGVLVSQITVTDPYAASWPELQQQQLTNPESWGYGLPNQMGLSSLEVNHTADPYATLSPDQDVIVLGTRHPQYIGKAKAAETKQKEEGLDPIRMSARMMGREGKVLVDTFDFFSDADYKQLLALGWKIRALGKGHLSDLERSLTMADRIAAAETLIRELRALRGQAGINPEELSLATESARARLRHLKSVLAAESAKKPATRRNRERISGENRVRNEAARLQQEMFYAQARLAEARRWFGEDDPRVARAQRAVRILQLRFNGRKAGEIVRLSDARNADVAGYVDSSVVRPALRKAVGIIKKSSFMHGVPARYLVTHRSVAASDESRVDAAVSGPVTRSKLFLLTQYLDQAFHMMDYLLLELLTPEEIAQMLVDIRHREEAAHPERTLHPETRQIPYRVYGNDGEVVQEAQVTVSMVHPVRWRTDLETGDMQVETDPSSWTNRVLKQLPDVRRENIPDTWGRYFVLVKPRLAPVEGAEVRAYPPGFDDLPPELGMWFARDVVGQGMMLTTLSSEGAMEQDKVLLLMVVDPFGAGSGRAGYLVWADSLQPVVSVTPEGWEMPVSVKGIGLFVGGDERFPHASVETLGTTAGRRVAGGMSKTGAVGQSTLAQAPGFVTGVGSEHGLTALSVTDANHNGLAPRLVFGVNFRFTHGAAGPSGQGTEYFMAARQEPDTARMGWSFRGRPFDSEAEVRKAAEVLGWNSAELLAHLPQPAIHIALSLDNVQANGYLTDPDSIVPPLYRERNPYGALFKYFGFSMQQTVMGWEQMKASKDGRSFEVEDRNLALMQPWLRSFLRHLLESGKVRREPFAKFDRLSRVPEDAFSAAVREEYGQSSNKDAFDALAIDLIDTLWNHYLAYEILRNRLQYGYSHTVESTYTGTADERFDPSSAENARQYLTSQRQILEVSRRLMQEGRYPLVAFNFERALAEVAQREQRLSQLESESADDFREVYSLGFYKPEVKPVVAVLDLSAVQAGERAIHVAGEIPVAASLVEKEVVTAGKPATVSPRGGLEEPTAVPWTFLSREDQPTGPSSYMLKIRTLLSDEGVRKQVLRGLELAPEEIREVQIRHFRDAYDDSNSSAGIDFYWYLWQVTWVLQDGSRVPVIVKVFAPRDESPAAVFTNNQRAYRRFNEQSLPTVPRLIADGIRPNDSELPAFQVVEYVPAQTKAKPDGELLAKEALRLWRASADEPQGRFLPQFLELGTVHFHQTGETGVSEVGFLNFDVLVDLPDEASVVRHLQKSSLIAGPQEVLRGAIRAFGDEEGRRFIANAHAGLAAAHPWKAAFLETNQAGASPGRVEERFMVPGVLGPMQLTLKRNPHSKVVLINLHGLAAVNNRIAVWLDGMDPNVSTVKYVSSRRRQLPLGFTGNRTHYAFGPPDEAGAKTFQDEVEDARRIIRATLEKFEQEGISADELRIILVGRRLGGQIAPILAHEFSQVQGVVSVVGGMEPFPDEAGAPVPQRWHDMLRMPSPNEMGALFSRFRGPMLVVTASRDHPGRTASALRWKEWARMPTLFRHVQVDDDRQLHQPSSRVPVVKAIQDFVEATLPLEEAIPSGTTRVIEDPGIVSQSHPVYFYSMLAGGSIRWDESMRDELKLVAGVQVPSKVRTSLRGVPGWGAEGVPVGWLPIAGAQQMGWPVVAVVQHQAEEVRQAFAGLNHGSLSYAYQAGPREGTAAAVWRALEAGNVRQSPESWVVISPGDQPFYDANLWEEVRQAMGRAGEGDLILGTANVSNPGRMGRVVRDKTGQVAGQGKIIAIIEQADIKQISDGTVPMPERLKQADYRDADELDAITEVNASVYAVRVKHLLPALGSINRMNAQNEFYLTDVVDYTIRHGGSVVPVEMPDWKMTDLTRFSPDLDRVQKVLAEHAGELRYATGLEETGQATFTMDQWQRITLHPDGSGLREAVGKLVKPPRVEGELKKVRRLVQEAVKKRMFETDRPLVLIRSPGRARIFMGHPDLPGIGAFSLDAATDQAIWMLAQLTDDGRVIADNLDPEYRKLEFDMDAEDVLPKNADAITHPRPQWYEWAMAHQFSDRWEGLVKGSLAFIRTQYLDPSKARRNALRGKGFRLLLADTDLPSGKGFSASSALPAGIGLALNALLEKGSPKAVLSMRDLTQLDYAAYLAGDLAGMADISAILFGELGQATVLWYDPDRIGERVTLPEDFRIFAVDSGVDRLDEPNQPDDLKNYAKYVKKLSNVAVRLAVLWMRAMSRENRRELGPLETLLTENHPTGVVRELTEAGAITQRKYAGMVGGRGRPAAVSRGAREKRGRFVHQVMAQIPNDWTLGQIVAKLRKELPDLRDQINAIAREVEPLGAYKIPKRAKDRAARLQRMRMKTPIPMRQMSWYGIRELERGLKYLVAAKAGDVETMLQMMKEAHNGDRALYDPRQGMLAGIPVLTSWGRSGSVEAYQRSLAEIDGKVDQFEAAMKSGAAARIGGAGLGGLIMVGQKASAYNRSKRWWTRRGHQVIEVEPSAGARVIRLPNAAALAGLEDNSSIPGTVWVPVQMVQTYVSDEEVQRDIERGFLRRDEQQGLLAPVIRDPKAPLAHTLHGRSVFSELSSDQLVQGTWTKVVKGAGTVDEERHPGSPFGFDPYHPNEAQWFRGGETEPEARKEAGAAVAFQRAYKGALAEGDPVVLLARQTYGIQEAPVLKPRYLLRPLLVPVKEKDQVVLMDSGEVLRRVGVPEDVIGQQVVFVYEVPLMNRVSEFDQDSKAETRASLRSQIHAAYGTTDGEEILRRFSARLALANHLLHRRLWGSFSFPAPYGAQAAYFSSLNSTNVTLTGHIVDLDTVTTFQGTASARADVRIRAEIRDLDEDLRDWTRVEKEFLLEELQELDHSYVQELIEAFADSLGVSPGLGRQAYREVWFAAVPAAAPPEFRQALSSWYRDLWVAGVPEARSAKVDRSPPQRAEDYVERAARLIKRGLLEGRPRQEIYGDVSRLLSEATQYPAGAMIRESSVPPLGTLAAHSDLLVDFLAYDYGFQKTAATAGLEEEGLAAPDSFIEIPSGVTRGSLVILTPETARVGLEALSAVRPPAGEPPLSIAVIVRDATQKAEIMAGLEEARLVLAMPILTLEGSGQTLAELIVGVQVEAWGRGLETFVIETLAQLKGIAQFLKFIPASVRSWNDWMKRVTTDVSA